MYRLKSLTIFPAFESQNSVASLECVSERGIIFPWISVLNETLVFISNFCTFWVHAAHIHEPYGIPVMKYTEVHAVTWMHLCLFPSPGIKVIAGVESRLDIFNAAPFPWIILLLNCVRVHILQRLEIFNSAYGPIKPNRCQLQTPSKWGQQGTWVYTLPILSFRYPTLTWVLA